MYYTNVLRGEIFLTDLDPVIGCEQGGKRPALIIQNNSGNIHSPNTIVIPFTTNIKRADIPTHVVLDERDGLNQPSMLMAEQPRIIDKSRLLLYLGRVPEKVMKTVVRDALLISLGLAETIPFNRKDNFLEFDSENKKSVSFSDFGCADTMNSHPDEKQIEIPERNTGVESENEI